MSDHDGIRDLLASVALDVASDEERVLVERHAATCHDCRDELDSLRSALAASLALDVPQVDPPGALKGRIMDAVRADADTRRQSPATPARVRRGGWWPAIAGTLAAAVVGLLAWNLTLSSDGDPRARTVAFTGTAAAPSVTGQLEIGPDGVAVMRIDRLPALPPDQGYELWSIKPGQAPRSEGFASISADGRVVVATGDVEPGTTLAITPEERTNTTAPTVDPIVAVVV